MGGGVCAVYRENVREMKLGNLGGGIQVEKTPAWGVVQRVLLKYGVRSLHRASNRRARVGEVVAPSRHFLNFRENDPGIFERGDRF